MKKAIIALIFLVLMTTVVLAEDTWQESGCKFVPIQHCYGSGFRMRCYKVMQRQCGTFDCHNEEISYTLEYPNQWVWNPAGYKVLTTLYETFTTTNKVCELAPVEEV